MTSSLSPQFSQERKCYSYVGIVDIPTDEEMREMEQEYMQRTTRQTA